MNDVVVFNGIHSLDFTEVRNQVLRIPEVAQKIREAQKVWDRISPMSVDFANFIGSDDKTFQGHIRLKSLTTTIVQVGLFERHLKSTKAPKWLMGSLSSDAAVKVAAKIMTFEELILKSPALSGLTNVTPIDQKGGLPILSGMALTEYGVLESSDQGEYQVKIQGAMDFAKMILQFLAAQNVSRFVNIGPGSGLLSRQLLPPDYEEIQILESIDVDPMLNWFWPALREFKCAQ